MINRGDIKLALDMVVNAQDDNLFGGEAEYVINTLEDCGNTIAAQAAVIEKLREAIQEYLDANDPSEFGCACDLDTEYLCGPCHAAKQQYPLQKALSIPTDSTQILAEVRRAEREKCAKRAEAYAYMSKNFNALAEEIRAME